MLAARSTTDRRLTRRQIARERAYFEKVRLAERSYAVALRKIAKHVGDIVRGFTPGDESQLPELLSMLEGYARLLAPWARSAAQRMIAEVGRRDDQAWRKLGATLGRNLRIEVATAPVGAMMRQLQQEQVEYITSIPIEAGQRVQALTRELVTGGRRYDEAVPMILASGSVTSSRATLIARTETAKAASALTQSRAQYVGATHFVWQTARDRDVRLLHRKLQGRTFAFDDPPIIGEKGQRGLPGTIFNCRCWIEPIIPDNLD